MSNYLSYQSCAQNYYISAHNFGNWGNLDDSDSYESDFLHEWSLSVDANQSHSSFLCQNYINFVP